MPRPDARSPDLVSGRAPAATIRGRNRTKADILVYRDGDGSLALKTYDERPWWSRQLVGRALIAREAAAYAALEGLDGVARLRGRPRPWALALELLPGRPLAEHEPASLPGAVFDRLDALLASIHDRGVALGDLHHRDVLVDERGAVRLVDFATAVVAGRDPGPLRRRLVARLQLADRDAAARLRRRYARDAGAPLDAAALGRHRRARGAKRAWNIVRGRSGGR